MIKVLLADNEQILLDGLSALLRETDDIELVATARDGQEAIALIELHTIDVAILDIRMTPMDGLEAAFYLRGKYPDLKILMLTLHKEPSMIKKVVEMGIEGYVLKERGREDLIEAMGRTEHQKSRLHYS